MMSFNFCNVTKQKNTLAKHNQLNTTRIKSSKQNLPSKTQTFSLNIEGLKQALTNKPEDNLQSHQNVIMTFPNEEELLSFRIVEASVLSPELKNVGPDIKSYAGQGIEDPSAVARFSISPLALQSMNHS
jgi:hypothetical protein